MSTKIEQLEIKGLIVKVSKEQILRGINLVVKKGEMHALMGPNGSGKSTLVQTIMGHPAYEVSKGEVHFSGKNVLVLGPNERAHLGLFLAFQYPRQISGVTLLSFLFAAYQAQAKERPAVFGKPMSLFQFRRWVQAEAKKIDLSEEHLDRFLNYGFSGGEKKRAEILQLRVLRPEIALLDEIDSGLDIDGLRAVATAVKDVQRELGTGILVVTHYQRILEYLQPDFVHVMSDGKIVLSQDGALAKELEHKGYKWLEKEPAAAKVADKVEVEGEVDGAEPGRARLANAAKTAQRLKVLING